MIHLSIGAASHVGRQRDKNQDCAFISQWIVALADGMGGPPAGDVASRVAVEALREALANPDIDTLGDAVQWANTRVWEEAAAPHYRGMGTTLCAVALIDDGSDGDTPRVGLANVGDSRIYLLRDGHLELRTQDHSLVEELVREGRISAEEALIHAQRNIVTRVLGLGEHVEVDTWTIDLAVGDRFMLCSDGLFNEVDEGRIAATLRRLADPNEAAHDLVSQANLAGGRDNITCIVVDVVEGPAPAFGSGADDRILVPLPDTVDDLAGFRAAAPAEVSDDERDDVDGVEGRSLLPVVEDEPGSRLRVFTWRTAAFVVAVLMVFGVAAGAVAWYSRSSYFVSVDAQGEIAVFQGRPGGLLWFDPTLVESTGVDIDELTPVLRDTVEAQPEFATFDDARRFLENLAEQMSRISPPTTTTTTTSTTPGTITTTTSAASPQTPTVPRSEP
jgi:PPM family protein phosphatase